MGEYMMQDEHDEIIVRQSNGPVLEFAGRMLAEAQRRNRDNAARSTIWRVWETRGGAYITEFIRASEAVGEQDFIIAKVIPPGGDEMTRRCAVMDAFEWSLFPRRMLKDIGWVFRIRVE